MSALPGSRKNRREGSMARIRRLETENMYLRSDLSMLRREMATLREAKSAAPRVLIVGDSKEERVKTLLESMAAIIPPEHRILGDTRKPTMADRLAQLDIEHEAANEAVEWIGEKIGAKAPKRGSGGGNV